MEILHPVSHKLHLLQAKLSGVEDENDRYHAKVSALDKENTQLKATLACLRGNSKIFPRETNWLWTPPATLSSKPLSSPPYVDGPRSTRKLQGERTPSYSAPTISSKLKRGHKAASPNRCFVEEEGSRINIKSNKMENDHLNYLWRDGELIGGSCSYMRPTFASRDKERFRVGARDSWKQIRGRSVGETCLPTHPYLCLLTTH